jgi:hypothetical protein
MLQDQEATKRNIQSEAKQSGNCLHCHAAIMPLYRKLGKEALPQAPEAEQIQKGLALVSEMNYWDAHKLLAETTGGKAHPVSCVDCHDPHAPAEGREKRGLVAPDLGAPARSEADAATVVAVVPFLAGAVTALEMAEALVVVVSAEVVEKAQTEDERTAPE